MPKLKRGASAKKRVETKAKKKKNFFESVFRLKKERAMNNKIAKK